MATNIPGMSVSEPREITSAFPEVAASKDKTQMAAMKGSEFSKGAASPMVDPASWDANSSKGKDGGSEGAGVPDMGGSSGATFGGDARDTSNYG